MPMIDDTREQVRAWRSQEPFTPFVITLHDERKVYVRAPEQLAISKSNFVFINAVSDAFNWTAYSNVLSIEPLPADPSIINGMTRPHDQLRPVEIQTGYLPAHPASVLVKFGGTWVLCTASVETKVPDWMVGRGKGWVTAEYSMLPGSTGGGRKKRDRGGKVDGRTTEIQRLIGRSLRSVVDLKALGERMITIDCDVLQADGGTRTASITGGYVSLAIAVNQIRSDLAVRGEPELPIDVLNDSVAAVSVGVVGGDVVLDLDYPLDSAADVDMNVVRTGSGQFIEIQGTGEEATFDDDQLAAMLALAKRGIVELTNLQTATIKASSSPS